MIKRPSLSEYRPFVTDYVMLVPDGDIIELLAQLMESTYRLFANLTDGQAAHAYAPGKWTVKQVLAHMIDTERTFAYRALVFSRNDIELPGFDQDIYINNANADSPNIHDLAAEFKFTRQSNLYMVKGFSDEQLLRAGVASNRPFSVRALVYMLAGHELHHLDILKERYGINPA